ncbi:hypothetical protein THRCLA_21177 [Thraustotheca clavata]|uniref:PiggyBac transposable element-derived protein domain-containing protein n=1 Tax=Thraustotheca clavata TaxID=74557 RepID=A0A1W0A041_9STRA|nr:hypothetical protein THRCLA_21177 [Thraustotheca clavata]
MTSTLISPFIDGLNTNRPRNNLPGVYLTLDKSMSAWRESNGKHKHNGIPHVTNIQRKPEGIGAEVKKIACAETGILLQLDLVEGIARQAGKQYHKELGSGTATVLRPSQPYFGTGRTVEADSVFASVKTLIELKSMVYTFLAW